MVAITLLSAPLGRAQQPTGDDAQAELEEVAIAHRDAGIADANHEPGGDTEGFEKCAQAYLQLYRSAQNHDQPDRLLWNAASCYDAAHDSARATEVRRMLIESFPHGDFAEDTLYFLAEDRGRTGQYEDAAERYESFAATYPEDARSPDALQNAYLLRLGLDQVDAAKADLTKYENLYEQRDLEKAAEIFWPWHMLLDSSSERRRHAQAYIDDYADRGGIDRRVVAEAVIAQIDWRRSCGEPLLHDACVTVERERVHPSVAALDTARERLGQGPPPSMHESRYRPPQRCGSPRHGIITVHERNAKLAAQAQARFRLIMQIVGGGRSIVIPDDDPERERRFRDAWGMARVYAADAAYEDYLRVDLPSDLDFFAGKQPWGWGENPKPSTRREYEATLDRVSDSQERLREFSNTKYRLLKDLEERYANVNSSRSPEWRLVAMARMAMIHQSLADQYYGAKVPRRLRSAAQVEAHCRTLAEVAEPLETRALEIWTHCLQFSATESYVNDFSRLCEDELGQRMPTHYPATLELFGTPNYATSHMDAVGLVDAHERLLLTPVFGPE